jgi:hypothetical protein
LLVRDQLRQGFWSYVLSLRLPVHPHAPRDSAARCPNLLLSLSGEKKKETPPCIPNNKEQKHLLFHRHPICTTCLHIRTIFRSVPSRFRRLLSQKVTSGLLRPVSEPIHQHHTTQCVTAIPETMASLLRQPNPATNQSLSSPAPLLCRAIALPQTSLYMQPRTHAVLAQSRSLA